MATQRSVTMKDVAERAGVSKAAVSAVLGGVKTYVRVSEATQTRILEAARQLEYRPNAVARSLRRRSTNVIGFYCGYGYLDARNAFLAEIIGGLQEGCEQVRKDLLLHGVFRGRSVDDIYAELLDGRIDGLVLTAASDDPLVHRLAASHLPVVAIVDSIAALPSVVVDDVAGSQRLAEYLARQGHRRVLYRAYDRQPVSVVRRRTAFYEAAAQCGLDVVEWVGLDEIDPDDTSLEAILCDPSSERVTVVVSWNDLTAYELLVYCRKQRRRVPEDIAVVGFDGLPTPPWLERCLTTIRAPWAEVARTAVTLLVAQIAGEEVPQETVLPVEFICGDTT